MARKRPHGSQFSGKNQPPAKKKQRKHEDYFEKVVKKSVAVQVYYFLSEEKIDRLERGCKSLRSENANLKGTVKTLRRSIVILFQEGMEMQ